MRTESFKHMFKKSSFVVVSRSAEVEKKRSELPIVYEEDKIIEAINENPCVIICGETGCGKTTQVPQFLYEAGYGSPDASDHKKGMIGITQPRRIAAIATASRVAYELNKNESVAYHVRFENSFTDKTQIKFMTDGVLLKEMENDFMLSKYSVIIIDEAHERSLHTDILIGLLSRVVPLRHRRGSPLKWIIMSATLCLDEFLKNDKLFKVKPPLITIEARQHPVTIHFSVKTPDDYIHSAFKKVCKIHKTTPAGHIIVFVPSQQDVKYLCHLLNEKFVLKTNRKRKFSAREIFIDTTSDEDDFNDESIKEIYGRFDINSIVVFPLYALLPMHKQEKIFQDMERGIRKCVVTTNVAETSITIPGVKYVVDTGKVKIKTFDKITGIQKFETTWCSKASANQRSGRAGRSCPGHSYRLYSSAVFQFDFPEYNEPDILRKPIQSIVLQMKCMNLINIHNFPFPTCPDRRAIIAAEEKLLIMDALEVGQSTCGDGGYRPTELGRKMNQISLMPRYAKMIVESVSYNVCHYMILIACALSVRELLINEVNSQIESDDKLQKHKLRSQIWVGKGSQKKLGDYMIILNCIIGAIKSDDMTNFCYKYGIRNKAVEEVFKLYQSVKIQVSEMFETEYPDISDINLPTSSQVEWMRKVLTVCFKDQIARKIGKNNKLFEKSLCTLYECICTSKILKIHPHSTLYYKSPDVVLYHEIHQGKYLTIKDICEVDSDWVMN